MGITRNACTLSICLVDDVHSRCKAEHLGVSFAANVEPVPLGDMQLAVFPQSNA